MADVLLEEAGVCVVAVTHADVSTHADRQLIRLCIAADEFALKDGMPLSPAPAPVLPRPRAHAHQHARTHA